jgi:hypothetical protein
MSNGDPNQVQVAAQLGISVDELYSLTANPAFPQPTGNDDAGNLTWNNDDINAFQATMDAAAANGWQVLPVDFPSAP